METERTLPPWDASKTLDALREWAKRVAEERGCDPRDVVFRARMTPDGNYVVTLAPQGEVV